MIDAILGGLVQLGSTPELDVLGKATGAFVAGLAFAYLAGARPAYVRHLLLAAAFVVALVIPLVVFTAPRFELQVPVGALVQPQPAQTGKTPSPRNMQHQQNGELPGERGSAPVQLLPPWQTVFRLAWISGSIFMFLSLAL